MDSFLSYLDLITLLKHHNIDFDDIDIIGSNTEFKINMYSCLQKHKTFFGYILYDDERTHWVVLCVSIINNVFNILYYDSLGQIIPPCYISVLRTIANKYFNKKLKIFSNYTRHQFNGSDCGLFCVLIIQYVMFLKRHDITDFNIINKKINNFDFVNIVKIYGPKYRKLLLLYKDKETFYKL